MEERRLPRSRRPHDRHVLVVTNRQINAAQRVHDLDPHAVLPGELPGDDGPFRPWRGSMGLGDCAALRGGTEPGFLGHGVDSPLLVVVCAGRTSMPSFSDRIA